jgi:hypothetical protein
MSGMGGKHKHQNSWTTIGYIRTFLTHVSIINPTLKNNRNKLLGKLVRNVYVREKNERFLFQTSMEGESGFIDYAFVSFSSY